MSTLDLEAGEPPDQLRARIASIAAAPGLSSTSSTKFDSLTGWLAHALELPQQQVKAVYMSSAGSFTARRGSLVDAVVALVVVGADYDALVRRAQELFSGVTECVVFVAQHDNEWRVESTLRKSDSEIAESVDALLDPMISATAGSAQESEAPVLSPILAPSFTVLDCVLLGRYATSTSWTDVAESDRLHYTDLRNRLKALAEAAAKDTDPTMKSHASVRNARGYAAKDMWSCVFPADVPNKSYGLQVAFIVSPHGGELCFCLGAGEAMERVEANRLRNRAFFERVRYRLAHLGSEQRATLHQLTMDGFQLRKSWRQQPGSSDFDDVGDWLGHATVAGGGGAAISLNLTPAELEDRGSAILDLMTSLVKLVEPILELDVDTQPLVSFDLDTLIREVVEAKLAISESVLTSAWAALESGKHVILTGPPGTGKTTLAEIIADLAVRAGRARGRVLTTATSDWTTYETIGGLRPASGLTLEFHLGQFLQAISDRKWLVIDELNRSNFDRAFGQLFTVLSGQTVVLPYTRPDQSKPVGLVPTRHMPRPDLDVIEVPESWRIIATMNFFDKSLLYEMSYAMMRRFAFVEVPSPSNDPPEKAFDEILRARATLDGVVNVEAFKIAQSLLPVRKIRDVGPASFLDIVEYSRQWLSARPDVDKAVLAWASFYSFLLPQFEGIDERDGRKLVQTLNTILGASLRSVVVDTLVEVLGLPRTAISVQVAGGDLVEPADPEPA